ncbi:phage baseplate assembly protein V [Paraburkholderia sp. GAS41]|jgi:phage baseplate assembly protein V|uniref:phage baseplate assembly protein V n=1 Tax=Paraburkholderia sp. GAS41 TaxID=3035134 RepID=UPI003D22E025
MDANESQRQFLNGCRKGTVLSVEGVHCRVLTGDLTTDWIQWFAVYAGESSDWLAPPIGEGVMLLFPSGNLSLAAALQAFNSKNFPPPTTGANEHFRKYRDGALVEYDFAAHSRTANLPAGATVLIVAPSAVK